MIIIWADNMAHKKVHETSTNPSKILSTATLVVDETSSFHGNGSLGDARSFIWNTFTRNRTITESRKLFPAPNTPVGKM